MNAYRQTGRRPWFVAIALSMGLHAILLLFYSWRPASSGGNTEEWDTRLEDRFSVVLRLNDRPQVPQEVQVPVALPSSVIRPDIEPVPLKQPIIPASDVNPSTSEPASTQSAAEAAKVAPLHGRLPAGRSIVYLIDRSSSMSRDGAWKKVLECMTVTMEQLEPDSRFAIVAYNSSTTSFAPRFVSRTETNHLDALKWLQQLRPEGRSEHLIGFREALSLRSDVVFLITDADDLDTTETRAIRRMMPEKTRFHAVILTPPTSLNATALTQLVEEFQGRIQFR